MFGIRSALMGLRGQSLTGIAKYFSNANYGGAYNPSNFNTLPQLYNAPTPVVTAAGDSIGLMLPVNANETIVNLLLATDIQNDTNWPRVNGTVVPKTAATHLGVPLANKLSATASTGVFGVYQSLTYAAATHVFSAYVFAGTYNYLVLDFSNSGNAGAVFNLSTGTVGFSDSGVTAGITALGGGYYRVYISKTLSAGANFPELYLSGSSTANTRSWTAAGTENLYYYGLQLELGITPSAYQPNAGSLGGSNRRTGGSNLLLWSDSLDQSPWTGFQTTISLAGDTNPIGVANAVRIIAGNNGASDYTRTYSFALPSNTTFSTGIRVKQGTITSGITIQFYDNAGAFHGSKALDLSTGVLSGVETLGTTSVAADSNGYWLLKFENLSSGSGGSTPQLRVVFTGTGSGTNYFIASQAMFNFGATLNTYSRNMEVIGGLLQYVVPFQSTSASRPLESQYPRRGIANLFTTTTDTFSTRNFTTSAVQYTLTAEGTAGQTITLTGTSTAGPLTMTGAGNRVSLTFTPTAGTLTLTKSAGTVSNAQIEFGAVATGYQTVTSGADITEVGQPPVYIPYFDGTDDYLTSGVQSFGTASLFAAAGQAWTVFGALRTVSAANKVVIAKASGGGAAVRTFQFYLSPNTVVICRGNSDGPATAWDNGVFHTFCIRWDGTALKGYFDNAAAYTFSIGSAAEEAEPILIGARTSSAPAGYFIGHNLVDIIDRALTDAEVSQLMTSLNQTFRYGL